MDVAAVQSGLKKNTTLRELKLFLWGMNISPILTSLSDHPCLRRLCLHGHVVDLTGLDTLLLSNNSKITELDIHVHGMGPQGLTRVLRALGQRPTLTKLGLHTSYPLRHDEVRLLRMVLCNTPSLQTLVLSNETLGSAELAELAPALYHNTSIKVLDLSDNGLHDMESARFLRDILRSNKTMIALDLTRSLFGPTNGAVECLADGLGSNSTLLKIDLSGNYMGDGCLSILAQTLGSRNKTLQKLRIGELNITSTGVGVLLETMEQSSHHITDS
jgi:Ran GTPase-activating protein (RanGAP) involved in mRNA processing and transport